MAFIVATKYRLCKSCGASSKDVRFYKNPSCKIDGLRSECVKCYKPKNKVYYTRYYTCNREKIKEKHKARYKANPEYFHAKWRQYYHENYEYHRDRVRKWREANPDKVLEYTTKWALSRPISLNLVEYKVSTKDADPLKLLLKNEELDNLFLFRKENPEEFERVCIELDIDAPFE